MSSSSSVCFFVCFVLVLACFSVSLLVAFCFAVRWEGQEELRVKGMLQVTGKAS